MIFLKNPKMFVWTSSPKHDVVTAMKNTRFLNFTIRVSHSYFIQQMNLAIVDYLILHPHLVLKPKVNIS